MSIFLLYEGVIKCLGSDVIYMYETEKIIKYFHSYNRFINSFH